MRTPILTCAIIIHCLASPWPQYAHDAGHTSFFDEGTDATALLCPADVTWKSTNNYGIPIIGSKSVSYLFDRDLQTLVAFNLKTGTSLWNFRLDLSGSEYATQPAVSDRSGLLYTTLPSGVLAINASNGEISWKFPLKEYSEGMPLKTYLFGDMVIVGSTDAFGAPGYLYAFKDSAVMELAWSQNFTAAVLDMVISPEGRIFGVFTSSHSFMLYLFCLNAENGIVLWQEPSISTPLWFSLYARDDGNLVINHVNSTLIVNGSTGLTERVLDGVGIVALAGTSMYGYKGSSYRNTFSAVSNTIVQTDPTGTLIRQYNLPDFYSSIQVVVDGTSVIYVTGHSTSTNQIGLFCFDINSGALLWRLDQVVDDNNTPVVIGTSFVSVVGDGSLIWSYSNRNTMSVKSCSSHGTCSTDFRNCTCDPKWGGKSCSVCSSTCSGHGTCENTNGSCVCDGHWDGPECSVCKPSWNGTNCEVCIRTCSGRGTCNADGACVCPASTWSWYHYSGVDCERETISRAIIGVIVGGGILVIAVIVGLIMLIVRRRRFAYHRLINSE